MSLVHPSPLSVFAASTKLAKVAAISTQFPSHATVLTSFKESHPSVPLILFKGCRRPLDHRRLTVTQSPES